MRLSVALILIACSDAAALHAVARTIRWCGLQRSPQTVLCTADSWSIVEKGELDMGLLCEWMGATLQTPGMSIRGMAGVLSIYCADEKCVLRGAHHHGGAADLEGEWAEKWGEGEARESKLVLMGSNLDHAALERGLRDCVNSPAAVERKLRALRFSVGDTVECRTQSATMRKRTALV